MRGKTAHLPWLQASQRVLPALAPRRGHIEAHCSVHHHKGALRRVPLLERHFSGPEPSVLHASSEEGQLVRGPLRTVHVRPRQELEAEEEEPCVLLRTGSAAA